LVVGGVELPMEVVLHRKERRSGARGDVELSVDVLDVVPDGAGRDEELPADLLVRLTG
jgi:hypothetical protein